MQSVDGSAPAAVTDQGAVAGGHEEHTITGVLSQRLYHELDARLETIERRCLYAQVAADPRAVAVDIAGDVAVIRDLILDTEVPR